MQTNSPMTPEQVLRWYAMVGVDDCVGETPVDRYAQPAKAPARALGAHSTTHATAPTAVRAPEPAASSAHLAYAATSLAELKSIMEAYDGCALKRTCQTTVFGDGSATARVMIVGEAPGADEDRLGRPFVGASGKLLEAMLAAIGLKREDVFISNVVPWRPPGNRKPEPSEVELCLPFIVRQIELIDPSLLLLLGGAPTAALLARTDSITRLRGHWLDFSTPRLSHPVPALPTFHPAYLLRTPAHKRETWRDLLALRQRLDLNQS